MLTIRCRQRAALYLTLIEVEKGPTLFLFGDLNQHGYCGPVNLKEYEVKSRIGPYMANFKPLMKSKSLMLKVSKAAL